jgi:phosphoribosylformylglycinamidine synthase
MRVFFGEQPLSQPLSQFRLNKKLNEIKTVLPSCQQLTANWVYFVAGDPQGVSEQRQLEALLQAKLREDVLQPPNNSILVLPRLGTLSPWASKTLNILQISGLQNITQVEHGVLYTLLTQDSQCLTEQQLAQVLPYLYDEMTQSALIKQIVPSTLFQTTTPQSYQTIPVISQGAQALQKANVDLGLALSADEIDYLVTAFSRLERDPSDVELMMFAQANSEHCRHKIFNASWHIDAQAMSHSLFQMIKTTYQHHAENILSAYHDNAAVLVGNTTPYLVCDALSHEYTYQQQASHIAIKVETHNHPTAISPFPGAATGVGGEIRDEAATGRGGKSKAGLAGFSVSNLHIPEFIQPWEVDYGKPAHVASSLQIMQQGPLGVAAFNNEFGRPNLVGYFRTYCQQVQGVMRGYHKPIMLAGGMGVVHEADVQKQALTPGNLIIVLGGPAMRIGLGGGAASSVNAAQHRQALDFASVQRDNPEMQRRAQQVIEACRAQPTANPILAIHDVGAGGLSNAIPELVHDWQCGARIALRAIPNDEPNMTPLEIWCNESQERYVLGIDAQHLETFTKLCLRERCPFAVVGEVIEEAQLIVDDAAYQNHPVNLPMNILFGDPPQLQFSVSQQSCPQAALQLQDIDIYQAVQRVLQLPTVASKNFLITIGDRTVGGLTVRDQMVGPWQVPVADCAVTSSSFNTLSGEAMAVGERSPLALIDPAASGRMAIGEAITNIVAASITKLADVKLSANWMAAASDDTEKLALYNTVKAVSVELCQQLNLTIPVGKDSLSMQMQWQQDAASEQKHVVAPLSLIASAFAPVNNVRQSLTPQLQTDVADSLLLLIDLGQGENRLGGSALAQVYNQLGDTCPDVNEPTLLANFFHLIQALNQQQLIYAYHDRSDGGLLTTICEMAFAAHCGVSIKLDNVGSEPLSSLFSEELGAVIQIAGEDLHRVQEYLRKYHLTQYTHIIGRLKTNDRLRFHFKGQQLLDFSRSELQRLWTATSYHLQKLRDNPHCAQQEYDALLDVNDPGLRSQLSFALPKPHTAHIKHQHKPRVAILREQGVNGHVEMAAAFHEAGFQSVDVHMSDILQGNISLTEFVGLAACGGFSYGDVLGAGRGWASAILHNTRAYDEFSHFFARKDTFTLGVCNGCQMLVQIKSIIPGSEAWPSFIRNQSEQFEARLSLVKIPASPSIFLQNMSTSVIPIVVAHGEGQAYWTEEATMQSALAQKLIAMQYVDNHHQITTNYPANPNGSPQGITGLTTTDGRVTVMMPHPERVIFAQQFSWCPKAWGELSPWAKMFANAYQWVENF